MIAVNNPAHRGVIAQALGVFNILIPCEPTEHRLSQHSDECMPCILAGAGVSETGRLRAWSISFPSAKMSDQDPGSHH
jgi:hypothetical protein